MTWVGDIFSWLGSKMSLLWSFAEPEAVKVFKLFIQTFEEAAIDAVKAETLKAISGEEKFNNAVSAVQAIVISAGWKASTTALETLVQDAYTSLKVSQGGVLVSAP